MKKKLEFIGEVAESKTKKLQKYDNESLNMTKYNSLNNLIKAQQINKESALHQAARKGNLNTVKRLLEEGVDIEAQTSWGGRPLYLTITHKHLEVAQFLIAKGADVNAETRLHDTSLNAALGFVDIRFAELLLKNGADVAAKTLDGEEPLHTAVRHYHIPLVRLLMTYGANIEAKTDKGLTPMEIALKSAMPAMVKTLILYGVNITPHHIIESITILVTSHERATMNLITTTAKLDSLLESKDGFQSICDAETVAAVFGNSDNHAKVLLSKRILYKSFRNKEFSARELQIVIEDLAERLNLMPPTLEIDLCDLKNDLHKLNQYIVVSSIVNEKKTPSLFALASNALKKNGLWDREVMERKYCDIAYKDKAIAVMENFLNKMCIRLKPESTEAAELGIAESSEACLSYKDYQLPQLGENQAFYENEYLLLPE